MALYMTLYNIFASPLLYVIISDIDVSVQSTISTTVTATFLEKSRTKRFQCGTFEAFETKYVAKISTRN